MKKILSLALALCLCMLFSVPALSSEITLSSSGSNSGNTDVTYTATSGYVVTIPASVAIDVATGLGSLTLKLGAATIFQDSTTGIQVSLSSPSYNVANNCYYMTDGTNRVAYTIKDASLALIRGDGTAAQWHSGSRGDVTLTLTSETPDFAGSYSDQLTFTVSSYPVTP